MKKNSIKLLDSEHSLPSIKKFKSTVNSPRNVINKSPVFGMGNSLSPKSKDLMQNQSSQDKPVAFEEMFNKKSRGLTMKNANASLSQKINNLFKRIADQDNYIRTLETEFNVSKSDFAMKALKGFNTQMNNTEMKLELDSILSNKDRLEDLEEQLEDEEEEQNSILGFLKDEGTTNKYKDLEIFKLRKQIDDDNSHISKLTQDNLGLKKKHTEFEEALQKISKSEKEISEIKAETKSEVKKIQNEIYDKENELNSKMIDIQEIAELLKRSEEKRNYSNEYNIFMESNSAKLKDRVSTLTIEKAKITQQMDEVRAKIVSKEAYIEDLKKKLTETHENIENEKVKNNALNFNYEAAKESLRASTEKYEMQKIKFQTENEKIQQEIEEKHKEAENSTDKRGKRRSTLVEKVSLAEICKDEAVKWQQKYMSVESELNQAKEELEKLKKNEIYLQNKLLAKDLMIAQIESLLKETEDQNEKKAEECKAQSSSIPTHKSNSNELSEVVHGMKQRYKKSKNEIKCVNCKKIPAECYLAVPCGHLFCALCKSKSETSCVYCSEAVTGQIHSTYLDRIVYNFKKETETINRATKLLGISNFK